MTNLRGTRSLSRSKLISRPYHGQITKICEENAMKEMRMTVPPTLLIKKRQFAFSGQVRQAARMWTYHTCDQLRVAISTGQQG